jgi:hypothetical protein
VRREVWTQTELVARCWCDGTMLRASGAFTRRRFGRAHGTKYSIRSGPTWRSRHFHSGPDRTAGCPENFFAGSLSERRSGPARVIATKIYMMPRARVAADSSRAAGAAHARGSRGTPLQVSRHLRPDSLRSGPRWLCRCEPSRVRTVADSGKEAQAITARTRGAQRMGRQDRFSTNRPLL